MGHGCEGQCVHSGAAAVLGPGYLRHAPLRLHHQHGQPTLPSLSVQACWWCKTSTSMRYYMLLSFDLLTITVPSNMTSQAAAYLQVELRTAWSSATFKLVTWCHCPTAKSGVMTQNNHRWPSIHSQTWLLTPMPDCQSLR